MAWKLFSKHPRKGPLERMKKAGYPWSITDLIEKSDFVQSKCINKQVLIDDIILYPFWIHSLPLKNKMDSFSHSRNWDLPTEEISEISECIEALDVYVYFLRESCQLGARVPVKEKLPNITDFLPPWVVFPLDHACASDWGRGLQAKYLYEFKEFLRWLSPDELRLYKKTYPKPSYLQAWGGLIDPWY